MRSADGERQALRAASWLWDSPDGGAGVKRLCLDCSAPIQVTQGSRCVVCQAAFELRNTRRQNAEFGGSGGRWQTIRRQVYERQEGRCARCGNELNGRYEVDHVRPRAEFRATSNEQRASDLSNLQALDVECHRVVTALRRAEAKRDNQRLAG